MLRDKSLIPLSREHQHALALCVQIDRALPAAALDLTRWQIEINDAYQKEISFHFAAEEEVLFPLARRFGKLTELVSDLLEEHGKLREYFAQAKSGTMDRDRLADFTTMLSTHIRKEERQLFEELQKLMSGQELAALGNALVQQEHGTASCRLRENT